MALVLPLASLPLAANMIAAGNGGQKQQTNPRVGERTLGRPAFLAERGKEIEIRPITSMYPEIS
ncbi:hypothetical protein CCACVL1_08674 [Corchorus capsularis]|uniref:Uncharacterized protein n=1 Tax=Corchorus capsularis TaxID=210143 RepID=A0A1R3IZA9_COCAP|nr:hypothetical protein CCACVL1_08674 [Corchorus capsularis]